MKKIVLPLCVAIAMGTLGWFMPAPTQAGIFKDGIKLPGKLGAIQKDMQFNKASKKRDKEAEKAAKKQGRKHSSSKSDPCCE